MATQPLAPTRAGKYVTFQISRQYFAVEASRVRQVAPSRDMMPIEHPMPCVRGAMVVRGRRVPVVDIRDRLGLKDHSTRLRSSVMMIEQLGITGLPAIGIIADKMTDVLDFRDRDFRDNVIQLRSYGRPYGRPKTLLDVIGLFSEDEITSLKSVF